MEIKRINVHEAKRRIKKDPELSKMLVPSGWKEIALDLDGDDKADVCFSCEQLGHKIDTIAVDLNGSGEFNFYLHDMDHNGIPDTIMVVPEGKDEPAAVAIGGEVELGFINLGVKVADLLVAENFMNRELGLSLADLAAYLQANAAIMLMELEKRAEAKGIDKVFYYLNDAGTYFLATVDGTKPRVRPFGTILLDDGKLYIQTGKNKAVVKQLKENPAAEICASMNNGTWIRIETELEEVDNHDLKVKMLDRMPILKEMYSADDDSMVMLQMKNATATFCSLMTQEPEVITF